MILRDRISKILAESNRPRADLNLLFREWALEMVAEGRNSPYYDSFTHEDILEYLISRIMEETK